MSAPVTCPHCPGQVQLVPGPGGEPVCPVCRRCPGGGDPTVADSCAAPTVRTLEPQSPAPAASPAAPAPAAPPAARPSPGLFAPEEPPPFGKEFLSQFTMVRLLGRGAMGAVYLMRQLKLDRLVAVKVVRQSNVTDELKKQLLREARILAGLNHSNIVAIHDVGVDGETPYTVCEYVEGHTLAHRLRLGPPLPLADALMIAMEILDGLRVAHERGVTHRDLKPDNILLTKEGRPKIADFGLARAQHLSTGATVDGVKGTPAYMSPEQCRGERATAASDLYAVGTILFELVVGKRPFPGPSPAEFLYQHATVDPPDLRSVRPDLPEPLCAVVKKAMQKNASLRFAGALEFSKALLDVYRGVTGQQGAVAFRPGHGANQIGEFELLSKIGEGGMGAVYRAWQPSLGRQVAVKCLLHSADPKAKARFEREIRALGRVDHPHLVKVFASGVEQDQWFYAMELLEGPTLEAVFQSLRTVRHDPLHLGVSDFKKAVDGCSEASRKAEKPIAPAGASQSLRVRSTSRAQAVLDDADEVPSEGYVRHVVRLIKQIAEAAHALHQEGIVHRDIKPGNIVVAPDGQTAVLMDLGLAQVIEEGQARLTRTRQFMGTLRYASPEQVLAAGEVDCRCDVYSLGVTLWELLTLRPIFDGGEHMSSAELMRLIQYEDPPPVSRHNPLIGVDLESIVQRCLEKNPARRYASALELALDLERFLLGRPVTARPVGVFGRAVRWAWRRPHVVTPFFVMAVVTALATVASLHTYDAYYRVKVDHFVSHVRRWGCPEGLCRITPEEASHRAVNYRIYRRAGLVERMDVVDGEGRPTAPLYDAEELLFGKAPSKLKAYRFDYRRDEHGQLVEETGRDFADRAIWTLRYTTRDTAHYTDRRGLPVARSGSGATYGGITWTKDGLEREVRYLDAGGRPRPDREGSYGERMEYDERGLEIETGAIGPQGQPIAVSGRAARYTGRYDERGLLTNLRVLDLEGKPTLSRGYCQVDLAYDERGNLVTARFTGPDGKPCPSPTGEAVATCSYDGRGRMAELRFVGVDGKPCGGLYGDAVTTVRFDNRGDVVTESYFGADGRPAAGFGGAARVVKKYDQVRNPIEESFQDAEGRPTVNLEGVARATQAFDERGNLTERQHFGPDGKPKASSAGWARAAWTWDERDNCIETRTFGPDGKPVVTREGYARMVQAYDDHGNCIEIVYHGADGRERLAGAACTRVKQRYDASGLLVEQRFVDPSGRPSVNREGFSRIEFSHAPTGDVVELAGHTPDGKVVKMPPPPSSPGAPAGR